MRRSPEIYIEMHKLGLSTAQIAAQLGAKKNTVIATLRNHGVLRRAPGRDIEDAVALWTIGKARSCFKMRGDRPFDLLIDGARVDVKSARVCTSGGRAFYYFAIHHKQSTQAKADLVDDYYLVLTDQPRRPIFRVPASRVAVKRSLSLPANTSLSKYQPELIGHRDEGQVMPLTH